MDGNERKGGSPSLAKSAPADRISIPALREQSAEAHHTLSVQRVEASVFLALVEAAEAMHDYDPDSFATWERIVAALARFDFGEET